MAISRPAGHLFRVPGNLCGKTDDLLKAPREHAGGRGLTRNAPREHSGSGPDTQHAPWQQLPPGAQHMIVVAVLPCIWISPPIVIGPAAKRSAGRGHNNHPDASHDVVPQGTDFGLVMQIHVAGEVKVAA